VESVNEQRPVDTLIESITPGVRVTVIASVMLEAGLLLPLSYDESGLHCSKVSVNVRLVSIRNGMAESMPEPLLLPALEPPLPALLEPPLPEALPPLELLAPLELAPPLPFPRIPPASFLQMVTPASVTHPVPLLPPLPLPPPPPSPVEKFPLPTTSSHADDASEHPAIDASRTHVLALTKTSPRT
jgi:hypothetical protein